MKLLQEMLAIEANKIAIADQQLGEAGRTHSVPSGTMTGYVRPEHSDKNRLASRHRSFSSDNTPTGDGTFKRGAPEHKARAFDKVNPKTGARPDRSVLPQKGNGKYFAVEASNEGDFIMVLVMRDDIDSHDYYGINVVFMSDGTVTKSIADHESQEQWVEDKDKIIAVARKYVGGDKIAAFVKRGGDSEHRKPDDWDNGENKSYAGPKLGKKGASRRGKAVSETLAEGKGYLDRKVDDWMEDNNIHSVEGPRGLKALNSLSKVLGYSDLDDFLEDNSGAIEAIFDFVRAQNNQDWIESIDKSLDSQ